MKPALKTLMLIFALLAGIFLAGCPMDAADDGTSISGATPEPITVSELDGTSWTYGFGGETFFTIKFGSDSRSVTCVDFSATVHTCTYRVDGSTVTIYKDDGTVYMELTYLSGYLLPNAMEFTTTGSLGSFSAARLAGTTWTYSYDTYNTFTIEFGSDGSSVTCVGYSGTYSVDGSTVIISIGGAEVTRLVYSSGKLIMGDEMVIFIKS